MPKPKVLVTRLLPEKPLDLLREHCTVDLYDKHDPMPRELLMDKVAQVDAVICLLTDGMGRIGQAVARRAQAFGMEVAYVPSARRRKRPMSRFDDGLRATPMPFDELMRTSDVVAVHCPLTPETHHLIDARALSLMKPTAYLVNVARGPVVDEVALARALRERQIAGAGLDVFENEPTVHADLLDLENVLLLPHIGSATVETRTAMAQLAVDNCLAVLQGRRPPTPVPELTDLPIYS